ncbi:MAG TPA: glycosyltransferase family 4 protein, partial [Spirochaetales bacterium]|nr:glycosyltransferase family 4 protein [Spirochaetales bacterium]
MPRALSIAILAPGELFGGVERQILDLNACASERDGLAYTTCLFHDHTLAAALRRDGVTPEILLGRGRYDVAAATSLARDLSRRSFAVVHAHGYRGLVSLAAAHRLGVGSPPVVKTEHGLPELGRGLSFSAAKTMANHRLDLWATHRLDAVVCY